MLTAIAILPSFRAPFERPIIPNRIPRGPRNTGTKTKAKAPEIIPATAQLRPGVRTSVASLIGPGFFIGQAAVGGVYTGDLTLAGGEAEKQHGGTQDNSRGAEPVGAEKVSQNAEAYAQGAGYDARPRAEKRGDQAEPGQDYSCSASCPAPKKPGALAAVRTSAGFTVLVQSWCLLVYSQPQEIIFPDASIIFIL